jgi:DtxR family manganese transport transcriptional regulator
MSTPSQEDYLEAIWILVQEKGYARVSDIAEHLGIQVASVSRMVKRLAEEGLLTRERYRGFSFTRDGALQGQALYERHKTLEALVNALQLGPPARVYQIVEGIEHHFDAEAVCRLARLVHFIEAHPTWWAQYTHAAAKDG